MTCWWPIMTLRSDHTWRERPCGAVVVIDSGLCARHRLMAFRDPGAAGGVDSVRDAGRNEPAESAFEPIAGAVAGAEPPLPSMDGVEPGRGQVHEDTALPAAAGGSPARHTSGESSEVCGIAALPRPSSAGRTQGPGNPAGEGEPSGKAHSDRPAVKQRAVPAREEMRPTHRQAPPGHTVPMGGRPSYRRNQISTDAVRPSLRERAGLSDEAIAILQLRRPVA